jgi:hypothetical protein
MGAHGPIPKRSDQRRRRNSAARPITKLPAARTVVIPEADSAWHPLAKAWFASLTQSGQSAFYEPSDWGLAVLVAESMSRDLNPQVVGITDSGKVVTDVIPLKGASLSAYVRAMAVLLVTEGDRRRLQVELERPETRDVNEERAQATVTNIRQRLGADPKPS